MEGGWREADGSSAFDFSFRVTYWEFPGWCLFVGRSALVPAAFALQDATGFRGEKMVELCLTGWAGLKQPLFRPSFLGEKWPVVDFYVELMGAKARRPYFWVQAKATRGKLTNRGVSIHSTKKDVAGLLEIPGPTYVLGVHEPTHRVFAKSVHGGQAARAIAMIPLTHELTPVNLERLYNEVEGYWKGTGHKPRRSVFA